MRVAHILRKYNPAEWGGTETAIHQLAGGLRRQGVESIAYCPAIDPGGASDPLAESGCLVRRFRAFVPVWGLPPARRSQLVAVGGNLMSLELIRLLAFEPGLSVIHSHALGRLGGIGRTVARRRGLPFILTIHGGLYDLPETLRRDFHPTEAVGWEWGKSFGFLLRTRRLLDDADAVVTCNPREAELVRERHPGCRVMVQPHGVPAGRFEKNEREAAFQAFPQLRRGPFLLAIGRIDGVKNQGWLVREFPEIRRRHPGLQLVLAGACTDEAYGRELEREIRRCGDADIHLLGRLPPGDPRLVGLLQSASAVVLPSVSETFGLVILEAWAAGAPVLSSRTSGGSALIEDGANGLLFDLAEPAGFHRGVDALLGDPGLRAKLAAAGGDRVRREFDSDVLSGRMRRLYEETREQRHAHRPAA